MKFWTTKVNGATMVDLTYPAVQTLIAQQKKRHPTESRAFLAWVLENIYRLDEIDADDAVCDGSDDKGIDGIYVSEINQSVDVIQSKLFQNNSRTVGDRALREFVGTLSQFRSPAEAQALISSTNNKELAARLTELSVPQLLENGYSVRGIFVTNAALDSNGTRFVKRNPQLVVLDDDEIERRYVNSARDIPNTGPFSFDVSRFGYVSFVAGKGINVAIAPIAASELVKLPGIENGVLFEPNLRQSLGRTPVNREIAQSIETKPEHGEFLLYHNGITVVCEHLSIDQKAGTLNGNNIFVVNGCQSLSSLYDHKAAITDDLRLIVKFVDVRKNSELINKITHRSNNQNSIKARDFKSNDKIQVRLQNEMNALYGGEAFYLIKRGEEPPEGCLVIDNEEAARMLLSYDLMQPWSAHQTYKLFDELYRDIFSRPEVNAVRVRTVVEICQRITECTHEIQDQEFANYKLSQFFLLYLVSRALQSTPEGKEFWENPAPWVKQNKGWDILAECIGRLISDLIIDLNHELEDRADRDDPIDHKRELKSPTAVQKLASAIIGSYEKLVKRKRVASFAGEWEMARKKITDKAKKKKK